MLNMLALFPAVVATASDGYPTREPVARSQEPVAGRWELK